MRSVERGKSTP